MTPVPMELFALVTLQWDQDTGVPGHDDPVTRPVVRTWRTTFQVPVHATRVQIVDSIIPMAMQELGVPIAARPTAAVLFLDLGPNVVNAPPVRNGLIVPGRGGL